LGRWNGAAYAKPIDIVSGEAKFAVVASSPRNEAIHLPSRSIKMEIKLARHQLHYA
jgi:hypothetical protein